MITWTIHKNQNGRLILGEIGWNLPHFPQPTPPQCTHFLSLGRFPRLPPNVVHATLACGESQIHDKEDFTVFPFDKEKMHFWGKSDTKPTKVIVNNQANSGPYLAAAARRFLALGAPGSTERDLAARSNLLEAMEIFLRFPMTWIWSSFVWKGRKAKHDADWI